MGRAPVDGRRSGLRTTVLFTDGPDEVASVEIGSSRSASLGPRTGGGCVAEGLYDGSVRGDILHGMHRSECGVVKRFILSRVERLRAQTRGRELWSPATGNTFDTPLEAREMRVHVTAVTVGRHRSLSSWLFAPALRRLGALLTGFTGRGSQPEGSVGAPWTVPARGETAKR